MNRIKFRLYPVLMASALFLALAPGGVSQAQASTIYTPKADGTVVYTSAKAVIDASHTSDGYVMVKYTGSNPKVKLRIQKDTEYTYDITASGDYVTFPLTEGSGSYTVKVFENVSGTSYAQAVSQTIQVNIASDTTPFLYPNQFCNFNADSNVVTVSDTITSGMTDPLKKVEAIYNYAVDNITYDNQKAATVQSGYLPNVDATLAQKKGICFDYAAVMTSMLRAQGIPTKLVIGYAGNVYHAWVSVYIQGQGWVDNIIYFDGTDWKLMDPTFVSSGKKSAEVLNYVSNPANYRHKFCY